MAFAMASSVRLAWAPHAHVAPVRWVGQAALPASAPEPCGHGARNGHRSHQMRPECKMAPAVSGQRGSLSSNVFGEGGAMENRWGGACLGRAGGAHSQGRLPWRMGVQI